MSDQAKNQAEDIKFCPICGHEGNDVMCPICDQKMESLNQEIDRIAEEEDKDKKELLGGEVSLEEEKIKEESDEKNNDDASENI